MKSSEVWTDWQTGYKCGECGFEGWRDHFNKCCPACGSHDVKCVSIRHLISTGGYWFNPKVEVVRKEIRE